MESGTCRTSWVEIRVKLKCTGKSWEKGNVACISMLIKKKILIIRCSDSCFVYKETQGVLQIQGHTSLA